MMRLEQKRKGREKSRCSMIVFPLAKGDPTMENLPTDLRKLVVECFLEIISSRVAAVTLGAEVAGIGGSARAGESQREGTGNWRALACQKGGGAAIVVACLPYSHDSYLRLEAVRSLLIISAVPPLASSTHEAPGIDLDLRHDDWQQAAREPSWGPL
ncbi:hypothetical protein BOTBODRAFT_40448 [Botryobasidium botryosum FD-172 SS1]|uniref:Uncharacterized protein n=1 Tax=Botryobasidium botryosum (strain FD-172 SS1) TaxID=930990 RepID=A0A067N1R7_BOTB1|nr:hypothetical protein BOTBODRAFT_40448 [Botryobasidium botryosum FD-172 SS1]